MTTEQYIIIDVVPRSFYPNNKVNRHNLELLAARQIKMDGLPHVIRDHMIYKDEVLKVTRAHRFRISEAIKVVFIIPFHHRMLDGTQLQLNGEYWDGSSSKKIKQKLPDLVEGFMMCFPDKLIGRIDAGIYWGYKPRVLVRNIPSPEIIDVRQGFI